MQGGGNIVGLLSLIGFFLGLFAFMRHLTLLSEAKDDHRRISRIEGTSDVMTRFFVRAHYIHLLKLGIVVVVTSLIFLTSMQISPQLFQVRFVSSASGWAMVALLAASLGQLEAKARRAVREFYEDMAENSTRQDARDVTQDARHAQLDARDHHDETKADREKKDCNR